MVLPCFLQKTKTKSMPTVRLPASGGLVVANAAPRVQTLGPIRSEHEAALALALVAALRVEAAPPRPAQARPLLALVDVLAVVF
jgi:hypothetical protein